MMPKRTRPQRVSDISWRSFFTGPGEGRLRSGDDRQRQRHGKLLRKDTRVRRRQGADVLFTHVGRHLAFECPLRLKPRHDLLMRGEGVSLHNDGQDTIRQEVAAQLR